VGGFLVVHGVFAQKNTPDAVGSVLMRVLVLVKNSTSVRYTYRGRRRGPGRGCQTTTSGCMARVCNNAYRTVSIVWGSSPVRRRRFLLLAGSLLPELWLDLASPLSKLSECELASKFKDWSMVSLPRCCGSRLRLHVYMYMYMYARPPDFALRTRPPFGNYFPNIVDFLDYFVIYERKSGDSWVARAWVHAKS